MEGRRKKWGEGLSKGRVEGRKGRGGCGEAEPGRPSGTGVENRVES